MPDMLIGAPTITIDLIERTTGKTVATMADVPDDHSDTDLYVLAELRDRLLEAGHGRDYIDTLAVRRR